MQTLKQGLGFCLVLLFLLLPTSSNAEDAAPTVQKKEETVGRVTLESKEYPLYHYQMEADIGDGITEAGDNALHAINQGMWGFNKTIASFTLYSVNQLMSFDLISNIVDEAGIMSERIYEIMSGTFLSLFVILVGGTAAWRYLVNQQVGHAVKSILGAMSIMVITFWFYSDPTGNIKWLNDRGAELEGIASSANVLVSSDEFDSNAAYDSKEGIAVLENQLFNLMVKRPYLLLNYGSTKVSDVLKDDPNRVNKLLELKPHTEEGKEQRRIIVSDEVSNFDNNQMSASFSGERFGYLIVTILSTIALSIPILLLGIFKFLLQVWFLALVIFTAIPLVLSVIPSYSETALNHGKKLVGVILMKAVLVLLIAVITGLVTLLYESVKVTNGVEGYVFVVFLICMTIWGLFKYRSEIFEVASAGMIQGQQVVERATTNSIDKMGDAGETGIKGAKRMVAKFYRSHQNKKRQEEYQSKKEGSGRKTFTHPPVANSGRSEHRKAVGENTPQKPGVGRNQGQQSIGKGSNTATGLNTVMANRSASRNAGAAIVDLKDYKSEKGEGATGKGPVSGQPLRSSERTVSGARKPGGNPPDSTRQENRKQEQAKPSRQRTEGLRDPENQPSSHRNPATKMESKQEAAASREPVKHLTQWEIQKKIDARKANVSPSVTVKRSEGRKPKAKETEKDLK
ncbi:CD3337/EF1877 family mobilome membrane protein [Peribacillus sp. NPDC096448]|uniref:CD3337/EF1877 family mobilome membrane protein n=1 Tax=Peribacillus sp. NPDC096448 TaxID=3364395 RepID=UPI0037FDD388